VQKAGRKRTTKHLNYEKNNAYSGLGGHLFSVALVAGTGITGQP
jgi:hypothetical protein